MATGDIPYGPDPASIGKRSATRYRTEDAVVRHWDRVLIENNRVYTWRGTGSTFRIVGSAALNQPLWSIENTAGSAVIVSLDKLRIFSAQTVANTTHPPWYYINRLTSMPTGGTTFTKIAADSTDASSAANVTIRQGASADGTNSAITATPSGSRIAAGIGNQLYTAVGTYQSVALDLLGATPAGELILNAGQAYVVYVTTSLAADNLATRSFLLDFAWSEYTTF